MSCVLFLTLHIDYACLRTGNRRKNKDIRLFGAIPNELEVVPAANHLYLSKPTGLQPQNFSSEQKFLNSHCGGLGPARLGSALLHNVCDKLGGFSALTQIFFAGISTSFSDTFASGCGRYLKRHSNSGTPPLPGL